MGISTKHVIGNTWPRGGACGLRQAETPESWVMTMAFSWAQLQGIALIFKPCGLFQETANIPQIPVELTFSHHSD